MLEIEEEEEEEEKVCNATKLSYQVTHTSTLQNVCPSYTI